MAALSPPPGDLGMAAPDFELPDTSGKIWTLDECSGANGTLVMFICNHCPYVLAVIDRIVRDCRELDDHGVGCVAIMPNDVSRYPDDAPDRMEAFSAEHHMSFPYLYDESQAVAQAYGAVCTPDFFGFDEDLKLRYRGRLDASRAEPAAPDAKRELFEAMAMIAAGREAPAEQLPSMGCSIKWKEEA
jgi:peroxiredoxin